MNQHMKMKITYGRCLSLQQRQIVFCHSIPSFQTKVMIETLERMSKRLVYDPKGRRSLCSHHDLDHGIVSTIDEDGEDAFLIVQVVIIICTGVWLCLLYRKNHES